MKSFVGWGKMQDVRVSDKFNIGKHVPVVELEYLGGRFLCYQSQDISDAVQIDERFNSIEFEIQQDRKGNCKRGTTHLIHPFEGTVKLNGQLFQNSKAENQA